MYAIPGGNFPPFNMFIDVSFLYEKYEKLLILREIVKMVH